MRLRAMPKIRQSRREMRQLRSEMRQLRSKTKLDARNQSLTIDNEVRRRKIEVQPSTTGFDA